MSLSSGLQFTQLKKIVLSRKTLGNTDVELSKQRPHDPVTVNMFFPAGLSSPPANITTSAVPSIVTPIVNGFTGIPHQPNGHPAVETVYTNGLPPYSTQSPTAADTLQQAFTGVQQYTGV